jgi:hypothetical protein
MSDNRYFEYGCPPLMNDGRFISNYVRSSTFDQYIRLSNNINSSHDYRRFIQNNGQQIINNMKAFYHENNICGVEGKCLPISNCKNALPGGGFPPLDHNNKQNWYEELIDNEYAKSETLDFMMTHSESNKCTSDTCK